jgi:hypothetical protein
MAEPTIVLQLNEGSEGTPTWVTIGNAEWTGPDGVGDAHVAPVGDNDEVFFDNAAAPNDGELWNDDGSPTQVTVAGRNTNQNVMRALETGASDGTADPPVLTAFDDGTDAGARTNPTTWILIGTAGSSGVGCVRGIETTTAAPDGDWTGQEHDAAPVAGAVLEGTVTGVTCASALAASGNKTFNLAIAVPHDATPGTTTWVYALTYTYT